jgi:hypothetical protein
VTPSSARTARLSGNLMSRRTPALALSLLLMGAAACSDSEVSSFPTPTFISPTASTHTPKPTAALPTQPKKIVVIVMENSPYDTIVGNTALHFIHDTIAPNTIALTQMHANSAPSLPNYVWMAAGQSCGADGSDSAWDRTCPSLFDQMDKHGVGWTVFAEGYPGGTGSCFTGVSSDTASNDYARKHVPPLLFSSTSTGTACTSHVRNFPNDTPADGSAPVDNFKGVHLPALTFVIPNLCHDMHNTASQCGAAQGDQPGGDLWLNRNWASLIQSAGPQGAVILTWDEGETSTEHIATFIGGAPVPSKGGTQDGRTYDHSSTLRAIEDALGLPCLAGACKATPLPILIPAK